MKTARDTPNRSLNEDEDMNDTEKQTVGGVAAVDRALQILKAFGNDDPSLSLADIAARTGFYKSTILRLVQSLERFSFVIRGNDGRYRVGPAAWRLGVLFKRELRLEERLMPFLRDLATRTSESVAFWVPLLDQPQPTRMCLLRVESPYAVSHNFRVGDMVPLTALQDRKLGTTGRVIRAFSLPYQPQDEAIRQNRVFASWGERNPELLGVAAPIFGPDDELVGALTLSAPTSRRDEAWARSMKPLVLDTADQATGALGGAVRKTPPTLPER